MYIFVNEVAILCSGISLDSRGKRCVGWKQPSLAERWGPARSTYMVVPRQMSVYGVHLDGAIARAIARGAGELYVLIMARLRGSFALAPHHIARRSNFAFALVVEGNWTDNGKSGTIDAGF